MLSNTVGSWSDDWNQFRWCVMCVEPRRPPIYPPFIRETFESYSHNISYHNIHLHKIAQHHWHAVYHWCFIEPHSTLANTASLKISWNKNMPWLEVRKLLISLSHGAVNCGVAEKWVRLKTKPRGLYISKATIHFCLQTKFTIYDMDNIYVLLPKNFTVCMHVHIHRASFKLRRQKRG